MAANAQLILTASLERRESRGWHCREDYPDRDDRNGLAWTTMHLDSGKLQVEKVPVPQEWRPDPIKSEDELYDKLWLAWEH